MRLRISDGYTLRIRLCDNPACLAMYDFLLSDYLLLYRIQIMMSLLVRLPSFADFDRLNVGLIDRIIFLISDRLVLADDVELFGWNFISSLLRDDDDDYSHLSYSSSQSHTSSLSTLFRYRSLCWIYRSPLSLSESNFGRYAFPLFSLFPPQGT